MLIKQFIPDTVEEVNRLKYARSLSNWTYLSAYLSINDPSTESIGALIRMELDGKNRRDIIDRLASRLVSNLRGQLKREAMELHERVRN